MQKVILLGHAFIGSKVLDSLDKGSYISVEFRGLSVHVPPARTVGVTEIERLGFNQITSRRRCQSLAICCKRH